MRGGFGRPRFLGRRCLEGSTVPGRDRRPTGEGVKNLESPSMSPLVFLLAVSLEEVGADVKEEEEEEVVVVEEEEEVVVVNLVVSPAQQGSVTANRLLAAFADAA